MSLYPKITLLHGSDGHKAIYLDGNLVRSGTGLSALDLMDALGIDYENDHENYKFAVAFPPVLAAKAAVRKAHIPKEGKKKMACKKGGKKGKGKK